MKHFLCLASLLILTTATGCKKDETGINYYLSQCDAPRGRLLTDESVTVMQRSIDGKQIYYLGYPPAGGGYLVCSLTKELKKEGLTVKFSGYMKEIQYPDYMDPLWVVIELTNIKRDID